MAREIKIGVSLIGTLLVIFGYVVYRRLHHSGHLPPSANAALGNLADQPPGLLPSASDKPTLVIASAEASRAPDAPADNAEPGWKHSSRRSDPIFAVQAQSQAEPRTSYMPSADNSQTPNASDSAPIDAADNSFNAAPQTVPPPPPQADPLAPSASPNGLDGQGARDPFRRGANSFNTGATAQTVVVTAEPAEHRRDFEHAASPTNTFGATQIAANDDARQPLDAGRDRPNPLRHSGAYEATPAANNETYPATRFSNNDPLGDSNGGRQFRAPQPMGNVAPPEALPPTQPYGLRSTTPDGFDAQRPVPRDGGLRDNPMRDGALHDAGRDGGLHDDSFRDNGVREGGVHDGAMHTRAVRPDGKYVVEPNDSYWTISQKVYGTGAYFKAIHELNRKEHPRADKLAVGEVLQLPEASVLEQNYPDLVPKPRKLPLAGGPASGYSTVSAHVRPTGRTYVVEDGDTLFEISRHELGKAGRWGEIYELNRETLGSDFDYLRPGTELIMPSDSRSNSSKPADVLTRQPAGTYQR